MEQFRLLLAVVLCVAVFAIWSFFFSPPPKPIPDQAALTAETAAKPEEAPKMQEPDKKADVVSQPGVQMAMDRPAKTYSVDTPFFTAQFSDRGAALTHFTLKNYKETNKPDSPLKEMVSPEAFSGILQSGTANKSIKGMDEALYDAENAQPSVTVSDKETKLSFLWVSPEGIRVDKVFTFYPDKPFFKYVVGLTNTSNINFKDGLILSMTDHYGAKKKMGFEGPAAYLGKALETVDTEKLKEKDSDLSGKITWVASLDRYFMKAIIPDAQQQNGHLQSKKNADGTVRILFTGDEKIIKPGEKSEFAFDIYIGSKRLETLKTIGKKLDAAVDFGWFDIIAKFCLLVMNMIHKLIPNYGIAVILLTVLIKLLLWPLGNKSYKAMGAMKKLQPEINKIREKYEHDKTRMNQEIMALYKTYKVNPMSGCLPLLAQMPIFIGLYRMLYESVELRHAPFYGWITDLSAPDRLFNFSFSIWGIDPPTGIPVLTLIMGVTMFLQQKMSPPAGGDPMQAKMFLYFMPVMMTLIFVNFPAGLVLYWLVNNIISIAQQYYTQKSNS
ncbi:membrane protein insertase YidC [Desulforegula conservatrix]|uniref:membrane protein insertase YidC n=1 Tax=Desulforegula conservatrix TaxID=153026 RepID=UPI0004119FF9|nr:membrane protein insertase YidC [Desulforegula conservatrix]